jgi:hypothetical protein
MVSQAVSGKDVAARACRAFDDLYVRASRRY